MAQHIPRTVFQTWKYTTLPTDITRIRTKMIQENPEYTFILYDDTMMDEWIRTHTDPLTQACYFQLAIGAAKADLWRYLILYKMGGLYLDIDSSLDRPIRELVLDTDHAVVSRERNTGFFVQWLLAFQQGHPVLAQAAALACRNIQEKSSTDVAMLTGPGPFTEAINETYLPSLPFYKHMWFQEDSFLNSYTATEGVPHRCRFLGTDFESYASWKSAGADALYTEASPHWQTIDRTRIFKDTLPKQ